MKKNSPITTCYSVPQSRKNRIPAFFEQLEPRQLLSATGTDFKEYTSTSAVVVAEEFPSASQLSGIQTADSGVPYTYISDAEYQIDGTNIEGVSYWIAPKGSTITISGDFTGSSGVDEFTLITNGDVILADFNFSGIEKITIQAKSITINGVNYFSGLLELSASGSISFTANAELYSNSAISTADVNLVAGEEVTIASGVKIGGSVSTYPGSKINDLYISAPAVDIQSATIKLGGDFKIEAIKEERLSIGMGLLPVKIAEGTVSVSINNTIIEAKNITVTAKVYASTNSGTSIEDEMAGDSGTSALLYLGFGKAKELLYDLFGIETESNNGSLTFKGLDTDALGGPLSEILNYVNGMLGLSPHFLMTFATADASIKISGDSVLKAENDITITATAEVVNTPRTMESLVFAFAMAMNKGNAVIDIDGKSRLEAGRDIYLQAEASGINCMSVVSNFPSYIDPKSVAGNSVGNIFKPSFAMALGFNELHSRITISNNARLKAERDILMFADTRGRIELSSSAASGPTGDLAFSLALNFGNCTSQVVVQGDITAGASILALAGTNVDLFTASAVNPTTSETPSGLDRAPELPGGKILEYYGIPSATVTNLVTSVVKKVPDSGMVENSEYGLGGAIGLASVKNSSEVIIGSAERSTVVTAEGRTTSGLAGGTGRAVFYAESNMTPRLMVSSESANDPYFYDKDKEGNLVENPLGKDVPQLEQKSKGANIAVGVALMQNTARAVVLANTRVSARQMVDVQSVAQYLLPKVDKFPIGYKPKIVEGQENKLGFIPIDFLSGADEWIAGASDKVNGVAIKGYDTISNLFGGDNMLDLSSPGATYGLNPSSFVWAATKGMKDKAAAASIAYIEQNNTAISGVEEGAVITTSSGVSVDAVDTGNDTIELDQQTADFYRQVDGQYVTYQVEGNNAAITGLSAGSTYYAKIEGNKLTLYTIDAQGNLSKVDLKAGGATGAVHHFIFANDWETGTSDSKNAALGQTGSQNSIYFGEEHGLQTGDVVTYQNKDGKDAIKGLKPDTKYMVFVGADGALSFKEIKDGVVQAYFVKISYGDATAVTCLTRESGAERQDVTNSVTGQHLLDSKAFVSLSNFLAAKTTVVYRANGASIGGLEDGATYIIVNLGKGLLQICDIDGNPVNISFGAEALTGQHTFEIQDTMNKGRAVSFTGSSLDVRPSQDANNSSIFAANIYVQRYSLELSANDHLGLKKGDTVAYTSTAPLGGLENGHSYMVGYDDQGGLLLFALDVDGKATGPGIRFSIDQANLSATHSFKIIKPVTENQDITVDKSVIRDGSTFFVGEHEFKTGDTVNYSVIKRDDAGNPVTGSDGSFVYELKGTYTVVRVSDGSIKLYDNVTKAYLAVPQAVAGQIAVENEFILVQQNAGSSVISSGNGGLIANGDSFSAGDAVTFWTDKTGGNLTSGSTYYIHSVVENSDGTSTVRLSATKGGAAINVNLGSGQNALTLAGQRQYVVSDGQLLDNTGLYSGQQIVFSSSNDLNIKTGTVYYVGLGKDGQVYLAETLEDLLGKKLIPVSNDGFEGNFIAQPKTLGFSREELDLGNCVLEQNTTHGFQGGEMVSITKGDTDYVYYVVVFNDFSFGLVAVGADGSTDLVDIKTLFADSSEIVIQRASKAVVLEGSPELRDNSTGGVRSVHLENHGYVTGTAITLNSDGKEYTCYVIKSDADTFYLASSLAKAMRGEADVNVNNLRVQFGVQVALPGYGVRVESKTFSQTLNMTGKVFGATGKGRVAKSVPKGFKDIEVFISLWKNNLNETRLQKSGTGAGGALQVMNLSNTSKAYVSAGTTIFADGLSIKASNLGNAMGMYQSGATGQLKGFSGILGFMYANNETLAELKVNAKSKIALGNAKMDALGNSLLIQALDQMNYTQISVVFASGETAIGGSIIGQVIERSSKALLTGSPDLSGKVSVLGYAMADARTSGQGVALVVGGTKGSTKQTEEEKRLADEIVEDKKQKATNAANFANTIDDILESGSEGFGSGFLSDESQQVIDQSMGIVRETVRQAGEGTNVDGSPARLYDDEEQGQRVHKAYNAEIAFGYTSSTTLAMVQNLGSLVVAGFVAQALNDTRQITAAGGLAFTRGKSSDESTAGAGSVNITVAKRTTSALVENVKNFVATKGNIEVKADDTAEVILVAASMAGGPKHLSGHGYAGSLLLNIHESTVTAGIKGSLLNAMQGSVLVDANNDMRIITVAGGGGFSRVEGVGMSLGLNVVITETSAFMADSSANVADDLLVRAISGVEKDAITLDADGTPATMSKVPDKYNIIAIGASAGLATRGDANAGSLIGNVVTSKTTANITSSVTGQSILAGGEVAVQAIDQFGIISVGGSLAIAGEAKDQDGNPKEDNSSSIGGVVSFNVINSTTAANFSNLALGSDARIAGGLAVAAFSRQQILAIAGAAAGANGDVATVTMSINVITSGTAATVSDSTIHADHMDVHAANVGDILSVAGGVGLSAGKNKAAAVAVNVISSHEIPAIGANTQGVQNTPASGNNIGISASISGSKLYLGGQTSSHLAVLAETSSTILSIAAGIGISTGSKANGDEQINLAGSAAVNVIARTVEATITDTAINKASSVALVARDFIMKNGVPNGSRIISVAGQVGVNAKGKQAGAAIGVNVIASDVKASFAPASLTNVGDVVVQAESLAEIIGTTASVAVSAGVSSGASYSAALASNAIAKSVVAEVILPAGSDSTIKSLQITSSDKSSIFGIAVSAAVATGADSKSFGGTLAVNVITSKQEATLRAASGQAKLTVDNAVDITAQNNSSILAINVGFAGSGLTANPNVIKTDTQALIKGLNLNAGNITVASTQGLPLVGSQALAESWFKNATAGAADEHKEQITNSLETSGIKFGSNILAVSLNLAFSRGEMALGGAVAVNTVFSNTQVRLQDSTITSTGNIRLSAQNEAIIRSCTAGVAVSTSEGKAAVAAGVAYAQVDLDTVVQADNCTFDVTGDMDILARSKAVIETLAINMAVSTGGKAGGVFLAGNVITTRTAALIKGGSLKVSGNLNLKALDLAAIHTISIAAAVGKDAGGIANNTNIIKGVVEAGLMDGSSFSVGGNLSIIADSQSLIFNIAVGVAVSTGGSLAASVTASENIIQRDVKASLANFGSGMTVAGNVVVQALESAPVSASDWRNASYAKGIGLEGNVVPDNGGAANTDGAPKSIGNGGDFDPNKALFSPLDGIFSLVVSIAGASEGMAGAVALNMNWTERSVNASITGTTLKTTRDILVEAYSASSVFGAVLAAAGSTGKAAAGVAAAINVYENHVNALVADSTLKGIADGAKINNLTLSAINKSGATAFAVGIGAGSSEVGAGISITMNISANGLVGGQNSGTDAKREAANKLTSDVAGKGSAALTGVSDANLGGLSALALISNSTVLASGDLTMKAEQHASILSVNLAVGIGKSVGAAGAISVNMLNTSAEAIASQSNITAKSGKFEAKMSGRAWSYLLSVGGGKVGAGANISIGRVQGKSTAILENNSSFTSTGNLSLTASSDMELLTVGFAVGIGSDAGAVGSVSISVSGVNVAAGAANSAFNLGAGALLVEATNKTLVTSVSGGIAGGGKGAGAGAVSVNLANWEQVKAYDFTAEGFSTDSSSTGQMKQVDDNKFVGGFTASAVLDNVVITKAGNVTVKATNEAQIESALLLAGVAGTGAGALGVVVNSLDSIAEAGIYLGSSLEQQKMGAVSVTATNKSKLWATVAAASGAGTAAGAASVAINTAEVGASANFKVGKNQDVTADSINVSSVSEADLFALALSLSGAGTAAVGVSVAANAVSNPSAAIVSGVDSFNSKLNVTGAVNVNASNNSKMLASAISVAGAGKVGAGASVAVNVGYNSGLKAFAQDYENEESKANKLGGVEDNGSYTAKNNGGIVTLYDAGGHKVNLVKQGTSQQMHYLVHTDKDGNRTLISFSKDMVRADGTLDLSSILSQPEYRHITFTDDDTFTYQTTENGMPVYGEHKVFELPTSEARLENITINKAASLKVQANSSREILTIAAGAAGSGTASGVGSVAVSVASNSTKASISNAIVTSTGNVEVLATNQSSHFTVAGALAGSGTAAGGVAVAVTNDKGDTYAGIIGSTVKSTSGGIMAKALASQNAFSLSFAGAGSGVAAFAVNVSTTIMQGTTSAVLSGSTLSAKTNVEAFAGFVAPEGAKKTLAERLGGGRGNDLGSFAKAVDGNITKVETDVAETGTGAAHDQDEKPASLGASLGSNGIFSISASAAGSGTVAVGASISVNIISGAVKALVENNTITTEQGDLKISAIMKSNIRSYTCSATGSGVAAISGAIGVNSIRGDVQTKLSYVSPTGYEINLGGGLIMEATQASSLLGLIGSIAVGGSAGVGFGLVSNTIAGLARAVVSGANIKKSSYVNVNALRDNDILSYVFGVAGGIAGISGGVAVAKVGGTTEAMIENSTIITSNGTVHVEAQNKTRVRTLSVQATGGVVGVSLAVSVTTLGANVTARVDNSNITSKNLDVKASSWLYDSWSKSIGIAAGAISAGLVATVTTLNDTVKAFVTNGTIDVESVLVESTADWNMYSFAVAGAGGVAAGVAGAANYMKVMGTVAAYVSGSTIKNNKNLTINSYATPHIKLIAASASLAVGFFPNLGLGLALVNVDMSTTSEAYASELKFAASSKPIVSIAANVGGTKDSSGSIEANAYALGVGSTGVGVGGADSHIRYAAKATAYMEQAENTTLQALSIFANDKISLISKVIGGGGGLFAGIGAVNSTINVYSTVEASLKARYLAKYSLTGKLAVQALSTTLAYQESIAGAGALFGAVAAATAHANFTNTSTANLMASTTAGGMDISALNTVKFDQHVNTIAGSLINGSGAVGNTSFNTTAMVDIGTGLTIVSSDNVDISAINTILKGTGLAGRKNIIEATAGGLITVNVGGMDNNITAKSNINIGDNTSLEVAIPFGAAASNLPALAMRAYNDVDVTSLLKFHSYSLVGVPVVKANLKANLQAALTLAKGSSVRTKNTTRGDILMHAGNKEHLNLTAEASVAALASSGNLDIHMDVFSSSAVNIKENATIYSAAELVMAAGRLDSSHKYATGTAAKMGSAKHVVHGMIFDNTLIGLSFATGSWNWNQTTMVSVLGGADVQARGDIYLLSERGFFDLGDQTAQSVNELGDALGVAYKDRLGRTQNNRNEVNILGKVKAGVDNTITAEINDLTPEILEKILSGEIKVSEAELKRLRDAKNILGSFGNIGDPEAYLAEAIKSGKFTWKGINDWISTGTGDFLELFKQMYSEAQINEALAKLRAENYDMAKVSAYYQTYKDTDGYKLVQDLFKTIMYDSLPADLWSSISDEIGAILALNKLFANEYQGSYNLDALDATEKLYLQNFLGVKDLSALNNEQWKELLPLADGIDVGNLTKVKGIIDTGIAPYKKLWEIENTQNEVDSLFDSNGIFKGSFAADQLTGAGWEALFSKYGVPTSATPELLASYSALKEAGWDFNGLGVDAQAPLWVWFNDLQKTKPMPLDFFGQNDSNPLYTFDSNVQNIITLIKGYGQAGDSFEKKLTACRTALKADKLAAQQDVADQNFWKELEAAAKGLESVNALFDASGNYKAGYEAGSLTSAGWEAMFAKHGAPAKVAGETGGLFDAYTALKTANWNYGTLTAEEQALLSAWFGEHEPLDFFGQANITTWYTFDQATVDAVKLIKSYGNAADAFAKKLASCRTALESSAADWEVLEKWSKDIASSTYALWGHLAWSENGADILNSDGKTLWKDSHAPITIWMDLRSDLNYTMEYGKLYEALIKDAAMLYLMKDAAYNPKDLENAQKELSYYVTGQNSDLLGTKLTDNKDENPLIKEYKSLQNAMADRGSAPGLGAELTARMREIEQLLLENGFGFMQNGMFFLSNDMQYVKTESVRVQQSSVYTKTEKLTGTGTIEAEGASGITVVNNSHLGLILGSMEVAFGDGGKIVGMYSIFECKKDASLRLITNAASSGNISISQDRNSIGDLHVKGDIININGAITIDWKGDVAVTGDLHGKNVNVSTMGTLRLNYAEQFYNVGGLPYDPLNTNFIPSGSIIALGDIFLTAKCLNVNGLIQSGVKLWESTMDELAGPYTNKASKINTDGTGTLGWTWDSGTNTFKMDNVYMGGGNITINGIILNTNAGKGVISVYTNPDVEIKNNTGSTVELNTITTSTDKKGSITINDTGRASVINEGNNINMVYTPRNDYFYHYMIGQNNVTRYDYKYESRSALGMDWLVKDRQEWGAPVKTSLGWTNLNGIGVITTTTAAQAKAAALKDTTLILESKNFLLSNQLGFGSNNGVSWSKVTYEREVSSETVVHNPWSYRTGFLGIIKVNVYSKTTIMGSQKVELYVIDCNKDIALKSGSGSGNITVSSLGNVVVNGTVLAGGNVSISSKDGIQASSKGSVSGKDINLSAKNDVGSQNAAMVLHATGTATLNGNNVYVMSNGNLKVAGSAVKTAVITAAGNLSGEYSASTLVLGAGAGVGSKSTAFVANANEGSDLKLSTIEGGVAGDFYLSSSSNLLVNQVAATGTVSLYTTENIIDDNSAFISDEADIERALNSAESLNIVAKENASDYATQVQEKTAELTQNMNATYHQYWALNNLLGSESYDAEAEVAKLVALGASEAEAMKIVADRAEQLELLGARLAGFDVALIDGEYDPAFDLAVHGTLAQKAELKRRAETSLWKKSDLTNGFASDLLNGTTTTFEKEEANVVGRDIILQAGGSIGSYHTGQSYTFTADELLPENFSKLDKARKLAYLGSEVGDRVINGDGSMTIYTSDDFNIQLNGGYLAAYADENLLIGSGQQILGELSSEDINVYTAVAKNGVMHLKADGQLTQHQESGQDGFSFQDYKGTYLGLHAGTELVAEASNGSLGTSSQSIIIGQHSHMTGRAKDNVFMSGLTQMNIDRMNYGGSLSLQNEQDIYLGGVNLIIKNGDKISTQGTLTLAGETVELSGGSDISFNQGFIRHTPGTVSLDHWLRIHDDAQISTGDASDISKLQVIGAGGGDMLYFGEITEGNRPQAGSQLDGEWVFTGENSGTYSNANWRFAFADIAHITAGLGNNKVTVTNSGKNTNLDLSQGKNAEIVVQGGGELGYVAGGQGSNILSIGEGGLVGELDFSLGQDSEINIDGGNAGNLVAGTGNNTVVVENNGIIGNLDLSSGQNTNVTVSDSRIGNVQGGSGNSIITVTDGLSGSLDLSSGNNTNIVVGDSTIGDITGGKGSSTLDVSGDSSIADVDLGLGDASDLSINGGNIGRIILGNGTGSILLDGGQVDAIDASKGANTITYEDGYVGSLLAGDNTTLDFSSQDRDMQISLGNGTGSALLDGRQIIGDLNISGNIFGSAGNNTLIIANTKLRGFTGGSGNDTLVINDAAGEQSKVGMVDMGAGSNSITDNSGRHSHWTIDQANAGNSNGSIYFKNVQTLANNGTSSTVDLKNKIDNLVFGSGNSLLIIWPGGWFDSLTLGGNTGVLDLNATTVQPGENTGAGSISSILSKYAMSGLTGMDFGSLMEYANSLLAKAEDAGLKLDSKMASRIGRGSARGHFVAALWEQLNGQNKNAPRFDYKKLLYSINGVFLDAAEAHNVSGSEGKGDGTRFNYNRLLNSVKDLISTVDQVADKAETHVPDQEGSDPIPKV